MERWFVRRLFYAVDTGSLAYDPYFLYINFMSFMETIR